MTLDQEENLNLDAIEARAKAATQGPWYFQGESFSPADIDGYRIHALLGTVAKTVPNDYSERNAVFIARSRTDIPALISALRTAEADRDMLEANTIGIEAHERTVADLRADNEKLRWVVQTGQCLECGTHFRDMPVARAALEPST